MTEIKRKIPEWSLPLLEDSPLKGASGGRSSGKSHFMAERLIERHLFDPNYKTVCIREIQRSIKFSSYQLIKDKLTKWDLLGRFQCVQGEIRDTKGDGIILFQGMQDHTADSIKGLENMDLAWFEESQNASKRSLELLTPTILRKEGAECWFSWNPDQELDAIEQLALDPDFVKVHCTYLDNPFRSKGVDREAEKMRQRDPDAYQHVWLGGYNTKSDSQVFNSKWQIDEFEPAQDWTPLYGMDFGFSQDPTTANECYLEDEVLYIYREAGKVGLELDDTAAFIKSKIPTIDQYIIRADSARPESISHLQRHGLPKITGVKKWPNSVEEGVRFIRGLKGVVIHPSCKETIQEFRLYSHKIDKRTGDILPDIIDKHNHYIDAIRYALQPLIQKKDFIFY